tara:strand:- start:101 stop:379 length:279 start_codon:yes stop_codon:yes gene_type:complete
VTVLEIMERANTRDTNLVIAYIKDAIMAMQSSTDQTLKVEKQDITKNQRDYNLPKDLISLSTVSVLDTKDDNKYKGIRRLYSAPNVTEDTSP